VIYISSHYSLAKLAVILYSIGVITPLSDLHFREWLKIDESMQPAPVVSMDKYLAAVDANDVILAENYRLRRHRARVVRRARELGVMVARLRLALVGAAVIIAVLAWRA